MIPDGFVADGYERSRKGAEPWIRDQVVREFQPLLLRAGVAEIHAIRLEIEREVQRRLEEAAPPDALY